MHPLTTLSEEEELFQKTVREFADQEIVPRAAEMDREAKLDPDVIEMLGKAVEKAESDFRGMMIDKAQSRANQESHQSKSLACFWPE